MYVILQSSLSFGTSVINYFFFCEFMQSLPRQVVLDWEAQLCLLVKCHINVEWCIVMSCQKFLGSSPQTVSHIVYLCRSLDLIKELQDDEQWLHEFLVQGTIAWELAKSRRNVEEQQAYSLIKQLDGLLLGR